MKRGNDAARSASHDDAQLRGSTARGRSVEAIVDSAKPTADAAAAKSADETAALGRRVALVIGNAAYQSVPQLANPTNDAKLIANALRQDGFDVTLVDDLSRER